MYSMINKNPETKIRVQPEGQDNKTASHWTLPLFQYEMAILPPGISKWDCVWELSSPILYSFLGLGLKAYNTISWFLWQTCVASGIKELVCKADQWGCFILWTSDKIYLLKYKWNTTTCLSVCISVCLSLSLYVCESDFLYVCVCVCQIEIILLYVLLFLSPYWCFLFIPSKECFSKYEGGIEALSVNKIF